MRPNSKLKIEHRTEYSKVNRIPAYKCQPAYNMNEIHEKRLLIKNMVCQRCILTVETILKDLDVSFSSVVLGEVDLVNDLSADQLKEVDKAIVKSGIEWGPT